MRPETRRKLDAIVARERRQRIAWIVAVLALFAVLSAYGWWRQNPDPIDIVGIEQPTGGTPFRSGPAPRPTRAPATR